MCVLFQRVKVVSACLVLMALLKYLKPKNGLPDPNGPLSNVVSSSAIASANREVENLLDSQPKHKRAKYKRYAGGRAEVYNL